MIGLDMIKEAFIHIVWSTVISFALILWLGSSSDWRMNGVIIGMNTGSVLLALMHYLTICKKIGVSIFMKGLVQKAANR